MVVSKCNIAYGSIKDAYTFIIISIIINIVISSTRTASSSSASDAVAVTVTSTTNIVITTTSYTVSTISTALKENQDNASCDRRGSEEMICILKRFPEHL